MVYGINGILQIFNRQKFVTHTIFSFCFIFLFIYLFIFLFFFFLDTFLTNGCTAISVYRIKHAFFIFTFLTVTRSHEIKCIHKRSSNLHIY